MNAYPRRMTALHIVEKSFTLFPSMFSLPLACVVGLAALIQILEFCVFPASFYEHPEQVEFNLPLLSFIFAEILITVIYYLLMIFQANALWENAKANLWNAAARINLDTIIRYIALIVALYWGVLMCLFVIMFFAPYGFIGLAASLRSYFPKLNLSTDAVKYISMTLIFLLGSPILVYLYHRFLSPVILLVENRSVFASMHQSCTIIMKGTEAQGLSLQSPFWKFLGVCLLAFTGFIVSVALVGNINGNLHTLGIKLPMGVTHILRFCHFLVFEPLLALVLVGVYFDTRALSEGANDTAETTVSASTQPRYVIDVEIAL